eukprot:PhM_4_TR16764/c1_g1_i6/m.75120
MVMTAVVDYWVNAVVRSFQGELVFWGYGAVRTLLPAKRVPKCNERKPKVDVPFLAVLYHNQHFVLYYRFGDAVVVYDSLRNHCPSTRDTLARAMSSYLESVLGITLGEPNVIACEQQEPGSNDCAFHCVNNACVALFPGCTFQKITRENARTWKPSIDVPPEFYDASCDRLESDEEAEEPEDSRWEYEKPLSECSEESEDEDDDDDDESQEH